MDIELFIILIFWALNSGLVTGKYTYQIYSESKMNFTTAKKLCVTNGELMAFIKSDSDMNDLKQYFNSTGGVPDDDMFIGIRYNAFSKVFEWLDKQNVTWAPWEVNEPDCMGSDPCAFTSNQNCVRLTTAYKFRTFNCNSQCYVLCGKAKTTDETAKLIDSATPIVEKTTMDEEITTAITRTMPKEHLSETTAIPEMTPAELTTDTSPITHIASAEHQTKTTSIALIKPIEHKTETTDIFQMTAADYWKNTSAITQMTSAELVTETTVKSHMTQAAHVTEATVKSQMAQTEHVTEATAKSQMAQTEHVTEATAKSQMAQTEHVTENTAKSQMAQTEHVTENTAKSQMAQTEHVTENTAKSQMAQTEHVTETTAKSQMAQTEHAKETTSVAKMTSAEYESKTIIVAQMISSTAHNALNCLCPKNMLGSKWLTMNEMNLTLPELRNIVEEDFKMKIKDKIYVDKDTLSKYVRSKTSAPDDRKSSVSF